MGDALLVDAQIARLRGAAVLDGGFESGSGRAAAESGPARAITGRIQGQVAGGSFRRQGAVLGAIRKPNTVIVNALGPQFTRASSRAGTAGRGAFRAASSPAASLADPAQKAFTTLADAEAKFRAQGITRTSA